jgi:hypothetical protein
LGAYRIPPETGLLIPSEKRDYRNVAEVSDFTYSVLIQCPERGPWTI